jgi:hypothetical protein
MAPGRIMLVDNVSTANPNNVDTFAICLRQYGTGTLFQTKPTIPKVSQEYIHIGYYNVKVKVERSESPWEELIEATSDVFTQLWKTDPTIKILCTKGRRGSVICHLSPMHLTFES